MIALRRQFQIVMTVLGLVLAGSVAMARPDLTDVSYGPDPRHRLDVYLPQNAQNAPIIVLVHGGGWRFGDKSNPNVWQNKVAHWTQQGTIVVAVNYRLLPQVGPLEQAQDVARALSFVQKHSGEWGGSDRNMILMGHSAGGHLVAVLSANPTLAHMQGARPWLGSVVLDTAALDVPGLMQRTRSRLYRDAFGENPEYWTSASPLHQLRAGAPPVLLVCSTRRATPCPEARKFQAKAVKQGGKAQTLPVDYSHRSINAVLGLDKGFTGQVDAFLTEIGLFTSPAQTDR
ncbi:alpha/beta hydrolase [Thalassovita sp.]|uniref:alpha/beta hydrolase n=1 Tax=Thalassovita sp. TaxID=1979401 RepID=UPI003B5A80A3